ncbi:low temperature requirement protein A [Pseudanabaena sp. FACHB-2040]|nr:low temperature requirement protein A [Pseudanabaena sp. FACHB-2040]
MPRQLLQLYVGDSETNRDRHATWLELFFDLVFVVAIAQLAHLLHDHLDWGGIANFAVLFIPIWWLWIDFSYYADQFNVEQGFYRLVMLGIMFGMIVLALTLPEALQVGGSALFASVYTVLRLVIVGLYFQAWRLVPQSRELTKRYTISFSIALVFWLVSIALPPPTRFFLWGVALLIEITTGPITYATIRSVPRQVSHMDERFGLFVIIVLGEAIIAVASGVADLQWQWQEILTASAGFIAAVSLWWMYFERVDDSVINTALHGDRLALMRSYVYGYSHVLVFMGIAAMGVGIQATIEAAAATSLSPATRVVLSGGASLFLVGLTLVQWATPRSLPNRVVVMRGLTAIICAALAGFGNFLTPFLMMGLLALILAGLAKADGLRLE